MEWRIPLADLDFDQKEAEAVMDVLNSKWLSMGPRTEQFERAFSQEMGVNHAFAVSNGTAALHIAHLVAGIKPGDEVIVPSFTFVATANSVLYCGATPIFSDITGYHDLNISSEAIQDKISSNTKAITVVHYAGYPCDMKAICEIAEDHELIVIEDAAHATGAEIHGKKCGTIGDIGCFSFFSNKNLATGEGGMIVTNLDSYAKKIQQLRSHGMSTLTWDRHKGHAFSYDVTELGYNYRLNEISSAIGIAQLKKLQNNNQKRKKITEQYREILKEFPDFITPFEKGTGTSSYHIFPVLVPESISRTMIMEKMKERGIQTSIHYPPVHLFSYYRNRYGYTEGMLPKTEYAGLHELTLPLYPRLREEDLHYIRDCLTSSLNQDDGKLYAP